MEESYPELAKQVMEPGCLLLAPSARPKKLLRPYVFVDRSYPTFVRRCCTAGLQKLVKPKQVWKHAGRMLINTAFAVAKSADDDRFITAACPVNELIDAERAPRPVFAYPPRLRGLQTHPGRYVILYNRDARH